ncbi:MAG: hypothetical protein LBD12_06840 [Clostridiales Family XIII bacterium]|jgi:hypothetical protein|nr:hypothetical protein [Clostridiales Family XIII bacterium]
MDDDRNYGAYRSFEELFEEKWAQSGQIKFSQDEFARLSTGMKDVVSPLKPLLGLFTFTAFDPEHPWHDNSDVFFMAWRELVMAHYPDNVGEIPLLYIGFHLQNRFGGGRTTRGIFLTDSSLYASVTLYDDEPPRRYAYPSPGDVTAGWASRLATQALVDFDPKCISNLVRLSHEAHDLDTEDNPADMTFVGTDTPDEMVRLLRTILTVALDAFISTRASAAAQPGQTADRQAGGAEGRQTDALPSLDKRVVELGLGQYIKYGTDKRQAKHFKKLGAKLGMDSDEEIVFSFSDATIAGPYGLVVTDRAIRSRDLMEEPDSQPLAPGDITSNDAEHTLVIGSGPVHHIGEFIPERMMPAVVTLLREYLNGEILRP